MDEFTAMTSRGRFEFIFMFSLPTADLPGKLRKPRRRHVLLCPSRELRVNLLISLDDRGQSEMALHAVPGRDPEPPPDGRSGANQNPPGFGQRMRIFRCDDHAGVFYDERRV